MDKFMDRIIDIIKKTGQNCIIVDKSTETAFAILPFSEYEKMVKSQVVTHLTQEELLDKINRDIAHWKSAQDQENENNYESLSGFIADNFPIEVSDSDTVLHDQEKDVAGRSRKYFFEPIE